MPRWASVLFGSVIGLGVIAGLTRLNLSLFEWPDFDWHLPQAWGDTIAVAQPTAQAMIAGSWAIASLTGGLIAVRVSDWPGAGWAVAAVLAVAGAVIGVLVPQPLWMQIAAVIAPLFAGLIVAGASGAA